MDRKFGRIRQFDPRSRGYAIRSLLPAKAPRSYTWHCHVVLDQGNESSCTGMAVSHEAAARPVEMSGITEHIATEVYHRARQLDDWPGEDYEGSSVLAAMKAGQERGWYKEYRWAFSEADLCLAVGYKGPAVLGINWYEGMEETDPQQKLQITGEVLGGHAILCNGFNVKTGLYRLHNSWGSAWGINGECYMSRPDMARLLREDGEACIPVVRSGGPAAAVAVGEP